MNKHDVDASHLPTIGFGARAPVWWAGILSMIMLSTIFALLFSSYSYLHVGFSSWPGPQAPPPDLVLPTLSLLVLLIGCVPARIASRAAQQGEHRKAGYGLFSAVILAGVFLVLRFLTFAGLGFTWYTSVYGSLVWIVLGFHTLLAIASAAQTCIVFGTLVGSGYREKQRLGVQMDATYWYFLALSWIPFYFLFFVYPNIQGS
jgi:heme/copper-type cytochrome/quinol oxidase subunit 3